MRKKPALPTRIVQLEVFEVVSQAVFVHDGETILYANEALERLLGYDKLQLQAMRGFSFALPTQRAQVLAYCESCLAQTESMPALEFDALSASGSVRNLEVQGKHCLYLGRPVAVFTCQDLSDIRFVQGSLIETSRRLNQIVENDPVAILVMDAEHRVTHWNAAAEKLTGVPRSKMVGQRQAWLPFYPEARPILADLIVDGTVDDEGGPLYQGRCRPSPTVEHAYEAEDFFTLADQRGRWLFFSAAPLRDSQGRIAGAIETLQDVTQRRDAEDALRRQQLELEWTVAERTAELRNQHRQIDALLENAPIGIVSTVGEHIVHSNRTFAEMFELDQEGLRQLSLRNLFMSSEGFDALTEIATSALSGGRAVIHETRMRTGRGHPRWIQLIGYPTDPGTPTLGTWWLLQDRSEIQQAQEELKRNFEHLKQTNLRLEEAQNQLLQSEKMASIGQLAAGVAHEINNPLGFVSSNLATLRRYVADLLALVETDSEIPAALMAQMPEAWQGRRRERIESADLEFLREDLPQLLDETEEGLVRVKKIVQDLKDFSRVDHNEWDEADLNAGLDSTLNVVRNEVKYKADVIKHYAQLPPVKCLAAQLNQVFMNLIVNAAQAIEQHGQITLSTALEGDWVRVSVADTGAGMSPEVRRRIFEPFYTTKPVGKGTGLGLSLSYSIIKKHGGRIEVESEPGRGTVFTLWLPVHGPEAVPGPEGATP